MNMNCDYALIYVTRSSGQLRSRRFHISSLRQRLQKRAHNNKETCSFRLAVGGNERTTQVNRRYHHAPIQNDCSVCGIISRFFGCNVLLGPVGSFRNCCPTATTTSAGMRPGRRALAAVRFDQPLPAEAVLQRPDVQANAVRRYGDSS